MNRIYQLVAALFKGAEGALSRALSAVLTMSISASVVIVCVLLARLLLRRAPKIFSYALWAVVLFRLLCPVTIESPVAIVPNIGRTAAALTQTGTVQAVGDSADADTHTDRQTVTVVAPVAQPAYHPAEGMQPSDQDSTGTGAAQTQKPVVPLAEMLSILWLSVGAGIAMFSIVSLLRLRLRLREALRINHNIYICDHISTPFVMGIVRPRVYLPSGLGTLERSYIILHEQHHIKRLDHVVKPVAFAALCIHWFNPLVWLAFALAMRDMEMSCDEAVLRVMDRDIRTDYSMSLLALASGKRMFAPTPLAFGESDTKIRIKNIVRYKKPAAVVIICAALAVIAACGALGGSRTVEENENADNSAFGVPSDEDVLQIGDDESLEVDALDETFAPSITTEGTESEPEPTQEEEEAAARAKIIASVPGLTLTEGAVLPYTTDNTRPIEQKDIHNITEAYLLCDFGLLTLTDDDALESLSKTYLSAEQLPGEPACGFYTPMFLKRADGTVGYVYPAFDGCGTFRAGDSYYEYDEDFFDFYALFAMNHFDYEELDEQGRVVTIRTFGRLRQDSLTEYEYDGNLLAGRSCVNTSYVENVTYEHDENGRLVKTVEVRKNSWEDDDQQKTYFYAYDERGNCVSITIRDAYSPSAPDAYSPDASVYSYTYDENDRLIERQFVKEGDPWPTTRYEYDEDGNCVKVITISPETGEPSGWWQYEYDDQGRVVKWDSYEGDGSLSDYYYNIQVYEPDGTTYQQMYDLDGNFVENVMLAPPTPVNGPFFYE